MVILMVLCLSTNPKLYTVSSANRQLAHDLRRGHQGLLLIMILCLPVHWSVCSVSACSSITEIVVVAYVLNVLRLGKIRVF